MMLGKLMYIPDAHCIYPIRPIDLDKYGRPGTATLLVRFREIPYVRTARIYSVSHAITVHVLQF